MVHELKILESEDPKPTALAEHQIWIFDSLHTEFLAAVWYDKPMSFNACLKQLLELKTLCQTTPLTIQSNNAIYSISSPVDFCIWLNNVFEAGLDYGFSRRICLEER